MAFLSDNNAYDISLFDDNAAREFPARRVPSRTPARRQSRKNLNKSNVVRIPQRKIEKARRRKHNPLAIGAGLLFSSIVVFLIGAVIFGQVQLTELNQQIADAEEELRNSQSEYTQMKMNVDAKYTTAIIEEYAQEELGMTKVSNNQKEFVDLSEGDKAEITAEEDESLIDKIGSAISSLWS